MPRDLTPEDKQILKYIGLNPEDWERVVPQDVSELADQLAEDSGLFIDSALMDMLSKLHDLTTSVSSIYVLCVENEVGKIAMEHAEVKQSAVRDLAMNLMKSEINFIRDGLKESDAIDEQRRLQVLNSLRDQLFTFKTRTINPPTH